MPDDRELAREILTGKISLEDAGRLRRSAPPRVPPLASAPASAPVSSTAAAPASAPPTLPPDAIPESKPPTLTNTPEPGRKFPCKQCGARLDFDPTQRALKCPYCGHVETIAPAATTVQEHDYEQALAKVGKETGSIAGRSQEVRCPGCGANVLLEDNVETDTCPFCATSITNAPRQSAEGLICPESLLPFRIAQRDAVKAFNDWIASRWFAPSNLRQLANLGQLAGVYMPFWTYDSMTYSSYTGMRGDDYWDTETYTERDANGNMVTRTRQVVRTRWTYVSGEVDHFFDDVLVCASKSLPENRVNTLEPWDLQALEGFKADFLAGFKTERYVVSLGDGFAIARQIMASAIQGLVRRDIGGDHQQIHSVQTQHVGVTYKHILLPMWLAVYRYQGQTYRILVNARTAEVCGDRPYSWIKIAFAVLAALILIAILATVFAHAHAHGR